MAMIHGSSIDTLHKLVELVASKHSQTAAAASASKIAAVTALRDAHYQGVNHFAVFASLKGLVEKLEVLGFDALAATLQKLVEESSQTGYKLLPEVLSFLIQLSERPAQSAGLENIVSLRSHQALSGRPLSWKEIWGDFEWKVPSEDIDYTQQTSDDGSVSSGYSFYTASHRTVKSPDYISDRSQIHQIQYVLQPKSRALSRIKDLSEQRLLSTTRAISHVSELYITCQTLQMLQGLPNEIFTYRNDTFGFQIRPGITIHGINPNTLHSILQSHADIGSTVKRLRNFLSGKVPTRTARAFAACIDDVVTNFNYFLSRFEGSLITFNEPGHCGLLSLLHQVNKAFELPLRLRKVLDVSLDNSKLSSVKLIEKLFEETCAMQEKSTGKLFFDVRHVFLKCLQGYLRSISKWTLSCELDDEEECFLMKNLASKQAILNNWPQQSHLLKFQTRFHAPQCLAPIIKRLFDLRRDFVLLRELRAHASSTIKHFDPPPFIEFQLDQSTNGSTPFQATFRTSLDRWIHSQPVDTSRLLCNHLLVDCSGWQVLRTLVTMYLGIDAIVFDNLTQAIRNALGPSSAAPQGVCTLLTDDIRLILKNSGALMACTVKATWSELGRNISRNHVSLARCMTFEFEYPNLVKPLIRPGSVVTYQRTFVLLLQLSHCLRALSQLLPRPSLQYREANSSAATIVDQQSKNLRSIFWLRFTLLGFLNILMDHVTNLVINPLVAELYSLWSTASDQDTLTTAHDYFAKSLATNLFQLEPDEPIRRILFSILELTLSFSNAFLEREQATSQPHSQSLQQLPSTEARDKRWSHLQDANRADLVSMHTQYRHLSKLLITALRDKSRREKSYTVPSLIDRLDGHYKA